MTEHDSSNKGDGVIVLFMLGFIVLYFWGAIKWEAAKPEGLYPVGTAVRVADSEFPWVVKSDTYSTWTKNRTYKLYYAPADAHKFVREENLKLWRGDSDE